MDTIKHLADNLPNIEARLHYTFRDRELLALAFIHRSYINENRTVAQHNERLEFLGDSVLGLLVAEHLYKQLPTMPEGELSYLRSRLVEGSSCVGFIQKLELAPFLLLGRGERMNDGRGRETILADLFEAIIGAIYLDGGLEAARCFLFDNFLSKIEHTLSAPLSNWKALLQDYCQKKHRTPPIYTVIEESGPDHCKQFVIAVFIGDQEIGKGSGSSKKEAQQAAAADAMNRIQQQDGAR